MFLCCKATKKKYMSKTKKNVEGGCEKTIWFIFRFCEFLTKQQKLLSHTDFVHTGFTRTTTTDKIRIGFQLSNFNYVYVWMKYVLIILVGGITDTKINKTLHAYAVMCDNRRHVKMMKINVKLQPLAKNKLETQNSSVHILKFRNFIKKN